MRAKVASELNRYIKLSAKAYDNDGIIPAWLHNEHQGRLRVIINNHYETVMPVFAKISVEHIVKAKKAQSTIKPYIETWIKQEALRKANMISETDRNEIINVIASGIEEGLTLAEMSKAIRQITTMTPYRAGMIARTETNGAANFAAIEAGREAERELGIKLVKKWIPTVDNRTRQEHIDMLNKDAINLDDQFYVGGEYLDKPCDSGGSPENIINCRCTVIMSEIYEPAA